VDVDALRCLAAHPHLVGRKICVVVTESAFSDVVVRVKVLLPAAGAALSGRDIALLRRGCHYESLLGQTAGRMVGFFASRRARPGAMEAHSGSDVQYAQSVLSPEFESPPDGQATGLAADDAGEIIAFLNEPPEPAPAAATATTAPQLDPAVDVARGRALHLLGEAVAKSPLLQAVGVYEGAVDCLMSARSVAGVAEALRQHVPMPRQPGPVYHGPVGRSPMSEL
jgi:hypothetical protein